jgi:hypothetical protein
MRKFPWKWFFGVVVLSGSALEAAQLPPAPERQDSMVVEDDDKNLIVEGIDDHDVKLTDERRPSQSANPENGLDVTSPGVETALPARVGDQKCETVAEYCDAVIARFEQFTEQDEIEQLPPQEADSLFEQTCRIARHVEQRQGSKQQLRRLEVQADVLLDAAAELGKLQKRSGYAFGVVAAEGNRVAKQRIVAASLQRLYQAAPTFPMLTGDVSSQTDLKASRAQCKRETAEETTSPVQHRPSISQK